MFNPGKIISRRGLYLVAVWLSVMWVGTMTTYSADRRAGAYGRELDEVGRLGLKGCMDAAVAGNRLYVIGGGKLTIWDISQPASPVRLGSLGNLGNTRQIEVKDHVAYITARSDGLFLVDVSVPQAPKLLSHFDTIEMATGIWITGKIALVAQRTYGVQLVDVRDPRKPIHLGTVRTGEAQSVVARNGIAYVGVWGARELVVCDIRNPRRPRVLSRTSLDGYGDGVWVQGKYCFVSTGHHAAGMKKRDESDPCFGGGHGLEIFDVTDPSKPALVSRIKTPRFYRIGMDMWDVAVSGRYAYLADTYNGFFILDVGDPARPRFVAHKQLPFVKSRNAHSPVGGFAVTDGYVYLAGAWSDLHVLAAPGLARPVEIDDPEPPVIPPPSPCELPGFRVYRPKGQVWAVTFAGDTALVAAGSASVHTVQIRPKIARLHVFPTDGFACDIKVYGNRVYVAEGKGGLSICRLGPGGALERIGRYRSRGRSIRQVVVPAPGRYALVQAGGSWFEIVDVSDPRRPVRVLRDSRPGLLYGYQIMEGLYENRYACCFWHVSGFHWYDLWGENGPVRSGDNYRERVGAANGLALLGSGTEALCTLSDGRYFLLKRTEKRPLAELPKYGTDEAGLPGGKPSIFGNTLYVSNRARGTVVVMDIPDITNPKLLAKYQIDGNPGLVVEHNGMMVIPAGYQGLLVCDRPTAR